MQFMLQSMSRYSVNDITPYALPWAIHHKVIIIVHKLVLMGHAACQYFWVVHPISYFEKHTFLMRLHSKKLHRKALWNLLYLVGIYHLLR